MKKETRKVLFGAAALAALMGAERQAFAATAKVNLEARIITSAALLLTGTEALDFGTLLDAGSGTLTIKTSGATAQTGAITPVGAAPQAGAFKIRGSNGKFVDFSMPAMATISNGTATMKIDNFRIGTLSKAPGTFTMGLTGGFQSGIPVGGRLNVGAAQATGTYTGTVDIITNYQ